MTVTGLALVALLATPAEATGTLDQSQTALSATGWGIGDLGGTNYQRTQTVTAGRSGLLDQVDLIVAPYGGSVAPLTVEIRDTTSDGVPGSTILASASVPAAAAQGSLPEWLAIPFSTPAHFDAGTPFAIVTSSSQTWTWRSGPTSVDSYAGGAHYSRAVGSPTWNPIAEDLGFRTYVTPVEADLSVTVTGPATAKSRGTVSYIVTVANAGPHTAANTVLTDRLPYGVQYTAYTAPSGVTCTPPGKGVLVVTCQLGDLAAGGSSTQAVTVKITARPGQGNINNVVSVSSSTADPDTSNNTAAYSTSVTR